MDGERAANVTVRVGGQAVLEGVMMRAGDQACVAVRRPDGGIDTRMLDVPGWARRAESMPFVRGLAGLGESLVVGVEALRWSEGAAGFRPADRRPAPMWLLLAISLVAVVFLIVVLPAGLAGLVAGGTAWFGVVEAAARLTVLGTYLGVIGRRADVRRVFEYHGAEHLVVAGHEAGKAMRPEALRGGAIHHPRCGTSFLLVVAAIAAVVHPFLPHGPLLLQLAGRILAVPLIVAVAYEVLTALGQVAVHRPGGRLDRLLLWPQRFTTRRPDDAQVEVAIAALQGALSPVSAVPTGRAVLASSSS
jgi:uncharacterized protein YqhQ